MKTNNILLILIILSFAGAVWLITENNALKHREIKMIDKWFDMEDDIVTLEGEVHDMKRQMDRIEGMIDDMVEKDLADTK
jgi:Na+-transporting NADH:ubiquinone oxidoreductase subunit NqrC